MATAPISTQFAHGKTNKNVYDSGTFEIISAHILKYYTYIYIYV